MGNILNPFDLGDIVKFRNTKAWYKDLCGIVTTSHKDWEGYAIRTINRPDHVLLRCYPEQLFEEEPITVYVVDENIYINHNHIMTPEILVPATIDDVNPEYLREFFMVLRDVMMGGANSSQYMFMLYDELVHKYRKK